MNNRVSHRNVVILVVSKGETCFRFQKIAFILSRLVSVVGVGQEEIISEVSHRKRIHLVACHPSFVHVGPCDHLLTPSQPRIYLTNAVSMIMLFLLHFFNVLQLLVACGEIAVSATSIRHPFVQRLYNEAHLKAYEENARSFSSFIAGADDTDSEFGRIGSHARSLDFDSEEQRDRDEVAEAELGVMGPIYDLEAAVEVCMATFQKEANIMYWQDIALPPRESRVPLSLLDVCLVSRRDQRGLRKDDGVARKDGRDFVEIRLRFRIVIR